MKDFTNDVIDTSKLPKFEEVDFSELQPNYWKVILINLIVLFLIIGVIIGFVLFYKEDLSDFVTEIYFIYTVMAFFVLFISRLSFMKKGFAFRNHDLLFRSGIIATNIHVVPYNRIQHVSINEGLISRFFGLVNLEIFTAGGASSDIEIPGIAKMQAENIKQLLMGKIQKQL
ncbi:PH domain-containing protein [Flavobacterium sp.]|uniref:PH domain-containing protein n=1 Tax=Flavobacterium sp. TaxID=239 RepID=UPI0022BE3450|nr:PH domain-containing protein [Flavobacterium sp.]MCZ8230422.1 PH domain-containing protein [Flavobacterium sp.]